MELRERIRRIESYLDRSESCCPADLEIRSTIAELKELVKEESVTIQDIISEQRIALLERISELTQEVRELDTLAPIMKELNEYQAVYYEDSYSCERLHRVSDSMDYHSIAFELETFDEYEDGNMTEPLTLVEAAKWYKDCLTLLKDEDVDIKCMKRSGLRRK